MTTTRTKHKKFTDMLSGGQPPLLTAYVSLEHESEKAREKNGIRWKNAEQALERLLENSEFDEDTRQQLLSKFREIPAGDERWDLRGDTLAIFGDAYGLNTRYLPARVDDRIHLGDHPFILPALRAEASAGLVAVLDVDMERARIIWVRGDDSTSHDLLSGGVAAQPPAEDERSDQLQMHTAGGGKGGAIFHGQGQDESAAEERLRRWIDDVAAQVADEFYNSHIPLIFSGDEKLFGMFREENEYPHLYDDACLPAVTVDRLSDEACAQAKEWMNALREKSRQEKLGNVKSALAHDQGSDKLAAIQKAAEQGKVAILLLADTLDESAGAHTIRTEITKDQQHANTAAVLALQTGAEVIVIPEDDMPDGALALAAYRY